MSEQKTLTELIAEFKDRQAAEFARLDEEQETYKARVRAKLEERLGTLLASSRRVKYTDVGREVIRVQALAALREVEPAADLIDVSTPDERAQGKLTLRKVAPIGRIAVTGAIGPPCHASMPCGCYGCPTCNGAQAPNPSATPAYGSPIVPTHWGMPKKPATQIIPPDQRGSKKPGGGGSKATRAANAEKGYRVCSYAEHLNREDDERPGTMFSTPDLATQCARKGAKATKETYLVLRDGARWKLLKPDGDEVVIG